MKKNTKTAEVKAATTEATPAVQQLGRLWRGTIVTADNKGLDISFLAVDFAGAVQKIGETYPGSKILELRVARKLKAESAIGFAKAD